MKRTLEQSSTTAIEVAKASVRQWCHAILIERLRQNRLGIEPECLRRLSASIDRVENTVAAETDPVTAALAAISGFDTFLSRMIKFALEHSLPSMSESSFNSASLQCGILFWCKNP